MEQYIFNRRRDDENKDHQRGSGNNDTDGLLDAELIRNRRRAVVRGTFESGVARLDPVDCTVRRHFHENRIDVPQKILRATGVVRDKPTAGLQSHRGFGHATVCRRLYHRVCVGGWDQQRVRARAGEKGVQILHRENIRARLLYDR